MSLSSVLNIAKPAFCGLGLYQSYRYSRALAVGWDEQRMLCTIDHIASITMLVLTSSDNLKFLCGEKFANRVWYLSFSSYAIMPGLYYLTKRVEESRVNETQFLKWEQEFPKNGDEDARTLGTRIEESLQGVGGRRDWFEEKCPALNEDDMRPLAQRIDEAHAQSERSDLENTFHDAVNFTYMHIADAVLLISAVQAVAAIYFGFNQIGNLIQTLFCAWAVAEQGTFWMNPEEDTGPLFKINDGAIVRAYEPTMAQLNLTVGVAFYFFYKGIPGKLNAILSLVARFAPYLIRNILPNAGERDACGFVDTPERIPDRDLEDYQFYLDPTEKHFEVFSIEDQFPNRNLTEMEVALQGKLIEDTSPFMDKVTDIENGLTNREKLEVILGKEGEKGYLHRHVIFSRTDEEMRIKEMELKNVFGALLKDWENIKSQVVSYHGDLKCRTATGRAINDLCLELYPGISGKSDGQAPVDPKQALKNRLEQKILLILQQLRDRGFQLYLQDQIKKLDESRGLEADQRRAQDRADRLERERCYNQIKDLSQITTALWWSNLKEYLFVAGKQLGWHLLREIIHSTATSRHQINSSTVFLARNLGLSSYQEARRDIQMMFAKQLQDIQVLDMVAPFYTNQFDPMAKMVYDHVWFKELMKAIQEEGDTRLDYEEIRDYMIHRAEDFGKKVALVEEYQEFEQYKPAFVQVTPGEYEVVGDAERYKEGREAFLNKYFHQVLFDVGLLA